MPRNHLIVAARAGAGGGRAPITADPGTAYVGFNDKSLAATGRTIEAKGGRIRVAAGPGAVEAYVHGPVWRDDRVVAHVRDGHLAARLHEGPVPTLHHLLAAREGEDQRPA